MTTDSKYTFPFLLQPVPPLNPVYSQVNAFKPFQPQLIGINSFYIVTKQRVQYILFLSYFFKYWHDTLNWFAHD